jgi:phosphoenolpyruvate-protein kinase (PTS system EI component)
MSLAEFNPGALRLMALACATAGDLGIDAAVCGEMAG